MRFLKFLILAAILSSVIPHGVVAQGIIIGTNHRKIFPSVGGSPVHDLGTCLVTSATSCTMSNVTLGTGDTLAVDTVSGGLSGSIACTWNSISLTPAGSGIFIGNVESHQFYLGNATAATASLVCNLTTDGAQQWMFGAVRITGRAASPLDQSVTSTGSGTSFSVGPTGTLATSSEVALAWLAIGASNASPGTWTNSFTQLTYAHTTSGACGVQTGGCGIAYAYFLSSSTSALSTGTTSGSSVGYLGWLPTFK